MREPSSTVGWRADGDADCPSCGARRRGGHWRFDVVEFRTGSGLLAVRSFRYVGTAAAVVVVVLVGLLVLAGPAT